jgi:hypothetical protein
MFLIVLALFILTMQVEVRRLDSTTILLVFSDIEVIPELFFLLLTYHEPLHTKKIDSFPWLFTPEVNELGIRLRTTGKKFAATAHTTNFIEIILDASTQVVFE